MKGHLDEVIWINYNETATGILVKYFWSGMPYNTILVRLKTIHGNGRYYYAVNEVS